MLNFLAWLIQGGMKAFLLLFCVILVLGQFGCLESAPTGKVDCQMKIHKRSC